MNHLPLIESCGSQIVVGNWAGDIRHNETKVDFQVYHLRTEDPWQQWGQEQGATHILYLGNCQQVRFVKLKKTVAYVLTDEDENGLAIWEKWPIRHVN